MPRPTRPISEYHGAPLRLIIELILSPGHPVPSHATLIHINQLLREVLWHLNQFLRGAGQVPVQVVVHGLRCNCEECYATTESESEGGYTRTRDHVN